jgi:hypothetical protein
VTYTGYIIVVLSFCFIFTYNSKLLYALLVFFIPFTATSIINIGDPESGSAIQPYMYLTVIWLVRNIFVSKVTTYTRLQYADILLYMFVTAVAFSLIMPSIIDGAIEGNITGSLGKTDKIIFSNRNITQFLYFLLGYMFTIAIKNYNLHANNLKFTLKIYGYSMMFVMLWGIIDFSCKKLSLPFPEEVFNNSTNPSSKGFKQVLEGDIARISSVSVEPSVLAQSVVIYIPFLLVSIKRKFYIFSSISDRLLLLLLVLFTFATTSFSGVISLLFSFWIFLMPPIKKITSIIIFFIGTFTTFAITYYLFSDYLLTLSLDKADSYSGLERFGTIYSGWENFLNYPYLGVGWGSITVNDLFVKILSSSGIFAISLFLAMSFLILSRHRSGTLSKNYKKLTISYYNEACFLSFIVLLFNSQLNGFLHYYGMFWLILGICLVNKKELIFEQK